MSVFRGHTPRLEPERNLLPGSTQADRRRPRIVVSQDRSWLTRLWLSRIPFSLLIRQAGGHPRYVSYGRDPDSRQRDTQVRRILDAGDALLLSGGVDVDPDTYGGEKSAKNVNPLRDRFEMALIREATDRGYPVLAICRGCQLLNVALGGTLHTIRNEPRLARYHHHVCGHPVALFERSHVASILGRTRLARVCSVHGQAVYETGDALRVVGRAADGIVEAIEHRPDDPQQRWMVGIQWHPELMLWGNQDRALIREFVRQASLRRRRGET